MDTNEWLDGELYEAECRNHKVRCQICGRYFYTLVRKFHPVTDEEIWVCGGECATLVMAALREACKTCDMAVLSNYREIEPEGDIVTRACCNCKSF